MAESEKLSYRILVVDDHPDTLRIMGTLLRYEGHVVEVASSCAAAMKQAGERQFDLLLTDLSLPDGDGIDLFTKINERMPVAGILVSGYDRPEDVQQSQAAGFAEHVIKPVDAEKLFKIVKHVCNQHVRTRSNSSVLRR